MAQPPALQDESYRPHDAVPLLASSLDFWTILRRTSMFWSNSCRFRAFVETLRRTSSYCMQKACSWRCPQPVFLSPCYDGTKHYLLCMARTVLSSPHLRPRQEAPRGGAQVPTGLGQLAVRQGVRHHGAISCVVFNKMSIFCCACMYFLGVRMMRTTWCNNSTR